MRFTYAPALVLLAALSHAACAADNEAVDTGSTGSGGRGEEPSQALYFEDEGTLTLAPGEVRTVAVRGARSGDFSVAFSLLGDFGDAFVEASVVQADKKGVARVVLHASNQATTFTLRAAVLDEEGQLGAGAELSVAVSDQGFGNVRVLPQYTGSRSIATWTASVVARTTCADLVGTLPGEPAGSLVASSSPLGHPIIHNAPVGPNLAVTLRAGHFAWGCADASTLSAGSTLDVKVTVLDKPIVLSATNLDLKLDFQPEPMAFAKLTESAGELLREGFVPSGESEPSALLDAMAGLLPAEQVLAFNTQRTLQDWDELAADHFTAEGIDLRQKIGGWVLSGLPLPAQTLTGNLSAKDGAPDQATLSAVVVGGLPGADVGVDDASAFTWTADPNDALILKGLLHWQPSRLMGSLARTSALAEVENASSMADALADAADCEGLAVALGAFPTCSTSCLATLCHDALGARWAAALSASSDAGLLGHIVITAAGPAKLDDEAKPIGFSGLWVGSIGDNQISAETKGNIDGAPPGKPPPP
ncbi:MAG: hypothetical protein U0359_35690 [Byssovorax sp.]